MHVTAQKYKQLVKVLFLLCLDSIQNLSTLDDDKKFTTRICYNLLFCERLCLKGFFFILKRYLQLLNGPLTILHPDADFCSCRVGPNSKDTSNEQGACSAESASICHRR